jgi:hypothetical protein
MDHARSGSSVHTKHRCDRVNTKTFHQMPTQNVALRLGECGARVGNHLTKVAAMALS